MIDHVLVDLITTIRHSFDGALLERQAVEERFQVDVFLGDVSWETSYSLPGEEQPPRVRADLSIDWPTWSQTSYRSWSIGETPDELPEVLIEVALRIQRLAEKPSADAILAVLSPESPRLGNDPLLRSGLTIEQVHNTDRSSDALSVPNSSGIPVVRWSVEASYEGSLRLEEEHMDKPETIDSMIAGLTRWVASSLVRLADLPLKFLPPDPEESD